MRVARLDKSFEIAYEQFLMNNRNGSYFVSNGYRRLLREFIHGEDHYLIALNDTNEIVGTLPCFLKRNRNGNILNSLPFYGSNGGIIESDSNPKVKKTLLTSFYELANKENCASSTLITSPFEQDILFYEKNTAYTYKDERIGQLTELPEIESNNTDSIESRLMGIFHYKTRNMIRKAQKNGLVIQKDFRDGNLSFLIETHIYNAKAINIPPKPVRFFHAIPNIFKYGKEYKIFTACKDNNPIAALLLFYYRKTVEYFTPVILKEFRNLQPLSLLIFEAMKDALENGYEWWNWGGTAIDAEGVYRFKKRWGTRDLPYYYYTRIHDKKILTLSKQQLLKEYSYFYVVPFENLSP